MRSSPSAAGFIADRGSRGGLLARNKARHGVLTACGESGRLGCSRGMNDGVAHETVASERVGWRLRPRGRGGRPDAGAAGGRGAARAHGRGLRSRRRGTWPTTPRRWCCGRGSRPTWLPDGRFWYRITTESGQRSVPGRSRQGDEGRLRPAGLRRRRGGRGGAAGPPPAAGGRGAARTDVPSPDGKRSVFIRDWNLWVRDAATGKETALTTDGVKDFGYATDNAGWARSDRPIVVWSPDSKQVATFQQDQRKVGEMYLVSTKVGHPELQAWKYPLPGDDVVAMIERVVIDVDAGEGRAVQDGARPAPLDAVRQPRLPRQRVGRRAVGARREERGVRLDVARPPEDDAAGGGPVDRRGARRARGDGLDVLRVGQRPRQLALPAGLERGDLVLASATTGVSSISTTCRPAS